MSAAAPIQQADPCKYIWRRQAPSYRCSASCSAHPGQHANRLISCPSGYLIWPGAGAFGTRSGAAACAAGGAFQFGAPHSSRRQQRRCHQIHAQGRLIYGERSNRRGGWNLSPYCHRGCATPCAVHSTIMSTHCADSADTSDRKCSISACGLFTSAGAFMCRRQRSTRGYRRRCRRLRLSKPSSDHRTFVRRCAPRCTRVARVHWCVAGCHKSYEMFSRMATNRRRCYCISARCHVYRARMMLLPCWCLQASWAILFLSSPAASYLQGACLPVPANAPGCSVMMASAWNMWA